MTTARKRAVNVRIQQVNSWTCSVEPVARFEHLPDDAGVCGAGVRVRDSESRTVAVRSGGRAQAPPARKAEDERKGNSSAVASDRDRFLGRSVLPASRCPLHAPPFAFVFSWFHPCHFPGAHPKPGTRDAKRGPKGPKRAIRSPFTGH